MKYLILIWVAILLFVSGAIVMHSFEQPKKNQAETFAIPTDIPTPTDLPTPTIDVQALQQRAVLQTRLQYVNTLIAQLQQRIELDQAYNQDVDKTAMQTQVDGFYVNPESGEQAMIVAANTLHNDQNTLNQLIEERNEIQAELGVN